jgi:hypothetical protein
MSFAGIDCGTVSREGRAVTRRAVARSAYGAAARLDRERAVLLASARGELESYMLRIGS